MLNSRNTHLIETSYDRLKSRNHISAIQENLAKAGVFRWFTNIHERIKDITIPFDNSLLLLKAFRTHKSFAKS